MSMDAMADSGKVAGGPDDGPGEAVRFAGLPFRGLRKDSLLDPANWPLHVITVNAEMIVRAHEDDPRLGAIIEKGTGTFDGQVPYFLARLQNRDRDFEKISGSDLIYELVRLAGERGLRMFFLGGKESALTASVRKAREEGAEVEGYSPPHRPYPFPAGEDAGILKRIEAFRPHILMVGFGAGKQEFWIDDHRKRLTSGGVGLLIGVGGSFEFFSGEVKRAPKWMQKVGLEGGYRLLAEFRWFRIKRLLLSLKVFRYALHR